jgi:hypothetical protein
MNDINDEPTDDMLDEYDFTGGVRGKYAGRFSEDCKLIVLDPDVAEVFPDAEAVNQALRELIHQKAAGKGKG